MLKVVLSLFVIVAGGVLLASTNVLDGALTVIAVIAGVACVFGGGVMFGKGLSELG